MHAKSAAAVALLAAAPMVNAGGATVKNACNFPVYLSSVSNFAGPIQTIPAGKSFSQGYLTNPNGGGVSLKVSKDSGLAGEVTQFEYTLTDTLWYDISYVNGNPFQPDGMSLVPSDSSCRSVLCPAGLALCHAAYNNPNDDWATAACQPSSDLTLVLCSGQDNSNTPSVDPGSVLASVGKSGKQHHKHQHGHKHHHKHHHKHADPAPAPAPAPSAPAPVVPSVPSPPAVAGALTTFVTQIVTVTARGASPTAA